MVPLLMSALVGIGVKLATDLVTSGVKKALKSSSTEPSTFSAMLDKARGAAAPKAPEATTSTPAAGPAKVLAATEPSPVRMTDAGSSVSSFGRAYGAATYHRMDVEAP